MSDPKDPKPGNDADASQVPTPSEEGKRSGRVSFDSRGNSVWEWQLETGVYSRDVNTQKLKKLDLGDLSIAETAIQKGPFGLTDDPKPTPGGSGFNPYNNAPAQKQAGNPYDNARTLGNKFAPQAEPEPEKRGVRSLDELRKLSERIKQQRKNEKGEG